MAVPSPAKAALRTQLIATRRAFVAGIDAKALSRTIAERVLGRAEPHHHVVALYQALPGEVATDDLIDRLVAAGRKVALPHVIGRTMRFLAWHPGEPLFPGPFALLQPDANAPEIAPDLIVAPMLGFDRSCMRIGYGAGHYDRAFAAHPSSARIGVAWSCQERDTIPADPWDVPLDAVATEREWITP